MEAQRPHAGRRTRDAKAYGDVGVLPLLNPASIWDAAPHTQQLLLRKAVMPPLNTTALLYTYSFNPGLY